MNAETMKKSIWVLDEIGQEIEKGSENALDSVLFRRIKGAIEDLQMMLEKDSIIESKTKYFTALLTLAQIGARYYTTDPKFQGLSETQESNILESLKESVHDLYDVDSEFEGVDNEMSRQLKRSIDKIDSVILELEIKAEV